MMKANPFANKNIGEIVAADFSTAQVFKKYGIDFCCHGDTAIDSACQKLGINIEEVENALLHLPDAGTYNIPFESWPLDLLIDYVLKIHHRGIRTKGPELLSLIDKVKSAHGTRHPELSELYDSFRTSLEDLESHLQKEENVLFPYLLRLFEAAEQGNTLEPMHCGTIQNPIRMMRFEHANEGDRYSHIQEITNGYAVPEDACASYRLMMEELETFMNNLFEHIHIENNIIFPRCVAMEPKYVRYSI